MIRQVIVKHHLNCQSIGNKFLFLSQNFWLVPFRLKANLNIYRPTCNLTFNQKITYGMQHIVLNTIMLLVWVESHHHKENILLNIIIYP
jgi:hypothetical protein